MVKLIKRTFQTLLALFILIGVGIAVYANSEKFATHSAALECDLLINPYKPKIPPGIKKAAEDDLVMQLRKDWIKGNILLNWATKPGETENGISQTVRLNVSTSNYQKQEPGPEGLRRQIDRKNLFYDVTYRSNYNDLFTVTRVCNLIDVKKFYQIKDESAAATRVNQKI